MDERILAYLEGTLSERDRCSFLEDVCNDPELEREMISCMQMSSVFASKMHDNDDPDSSWREFILKRRLSGILRASLKAIPALLLVAVLALGIWELPPRPSSLADDSIPTLTAFAPAGSRAMCVLPDGSEVWLNAHSKLTYPSSFGRERKVSLEGEAFFDVTSDKNHPFIVSTDKLEVKALGTKFNVSDYKNDDFVVSLLEGSVILYQEGSEGTGLVLNPNEQLVESEGGYVKKSFIQDPVMWVSGFYAFNNNSMDYILSKLELYYDVRIVVLNECLLSKKYTGKFRQADGVREILRIMSRVYPFTIKEDESSNTIYIQ